MVRLAHLSDIHITTTRLEWQLRDWFNKRLAAWVNHRLLGRAKRFRQAEQVLAALARDLDERQPNHVVFSGDATALGFESELRRAAEILDVPRRPGMAVPGNHDYCTVPAATSGLFEKYFEPWLEGRRIDNARYPFAQQVGPLWLIGLNSCTGNFWPWDAGGEVGRPQQERLARLLQELPPGPRILVTHYPVCLATGRPEFRARGMRDLAKVVEVVQKAGGIDLWIHGHRHHHYHLPAPPGASFPVICAGSATQMKLWSYYEYSLTGHLLKAQRRSYRPEIDRFEHADGFEIALRS